MFELAGLVWDYEPTHHVLAYKRYLLLYLLIQEEYTQSICHKLLEDAEVEFAGI